MDNLEQVKQIFQTLSDINRLRIVFFIGNEVKAVGEIVEFLGVSQPLVSHHLKKMKQCGILSTSRKGPFVNYYLSNTSILNSIQEFSLLSKVE